MNTIGNYRLVEELYGSGKTRVCRAVSVADRRPVVLKIISGERAQPIDVVHCRREFEVTRELEDVEDVIKVRALENVEDTVMIVMEDIGGKSLSQSLESEEISIELALRLAVRITHVLGQVHRRRIIHKDVTPANIIWNCQTDALRIIDFGIASQLSQERQEFESINHLEANLVYASPEQTGRVNRALDSRSDLYSLGVSLYQLFTGTVPFVARAAIELVHAHIARTPKPPHEVNSSLPVTLSRIILRLMSKMPDERYQTAWGLEHDLERCLEEYRAAGAISVFPLGERDASTRLRIPQKLYGRAVETAAIIAAFERAVAGSAQLVLVRGFSGTGKSALVQEVHRPVTERRGWFIAGKFDQYQRDVPFYAWRTAFEEFCKLLLKEDEAAVAAWRARIDVALGPIAKVLIDIIPSIELITGPQPVVPPLAGEQALNRLNVVFGKFLKAVCTPESPLVVFIDDWQWADAGSLSLMKSVMADKDIGHLLLIGAYRDNEVDPTHPMAIALTEVRHGDTAISDIDVLPLRPVDVDDLVRDTLGHPPDAETVSRLLHDKTRGNAFFLVQLLTDLYEQSKLSFDLDQWRWIWRREEIEGHAITDNVVDLMAARIGRLPARVQQTLIHAACIGDRFELSTLAAILGRAPHRTADDLETALQEGILLPVGLNHRIARQENNTANVSYKFVHDRVRQAAYGMLAGAAAEKIHHGIALKWLDELSADEQERQIFDIANQYNAGRRLITGDADRKRLIVINLQAGRRAKSATAYPTALQYFRTAFELSPAEAWASLPQETAELHLLAAEVAFLTKDYNAMEGWVDAYLDNRHAPLDRVAAYKIRLQAYVAQNRLSEAVDAGLHALGLLGVSLPREPTNADVAKELTRTLDLLQDKSLADLGELPAMRDPIHLAAMDLLGLVLPPAYWTSQELLGLVVFRMTQLSVTHGHSPNAGYGFSWWGILQCAVLGNIQSGFEFGEFAIELSKRHELKLQQPLFFVAWILRKFRRHLSETIPLFEQTYALALEKGDFEYASYARNNHMQSLFHLGHELGGLLEEMERAHRDLLRFQLGSSLYWHDIWWQTAWTFANPTAKPHVLAGPAYDEAESLSQHLEVKDISTLFLLHVAKLLLACFFDDPGAALGCAKQARANLPGGVGTHAFVLFHFYESLALLANRETEDTTAVDSQVAENQDKLKVWADNAPMNYRHHWLLVEAERQRVAGRVEEATQLYDQAIDQAHAGGFLHEEAFAHERAARAFMQRGLDRSGSFYLREALSLYERWGATAKAARLRAELSGPGQSVLMSNEGWNTIKRRAPAASGSQRHGDFDLLAVTQASQAISREIVIDNMITTLLRILIEHSGAQKAVLVLKDGADLVIRAQGRAGDTIEIDTNPIPINDGDALPLPLSLIHLVARTGKCQVIHDARVGTLFGRDPYFVEVRPLSVLGQPIAHQGKLVGVLYLENNLTAGAFTEERLELLQLVSAQAAISIENARLFEEQRRLADSFARFVPREFLSLLNKESILDIVLGDGVEKEMTVLFSDIRSFTAVIEALSTRESFQFINEYLSYMEPVILSHGGFVNQYIGDAIMALFAVEPQQALEAAVGMTTAVARYNAVREARGDQPIRLGIGLHTGMLMLGTIGGAKRLDCGVISDTVNTAARLEAMTKLFGATLIISDDLLRRTREPQKFATRVVGRIVVKGKTRPVTVIEVIDADLPERRAKKLATKAAFDRALERFVAGDFAQALTSFGQCRQQDPDDKAAAEYMHRCRALIEQPPAVPWEGLIHLETK